MSAESMIQKSLACDVVVQAEDVGRQRIVEKPLQLPAGYSGVSQVLPHALAMIQFAAQQVKRQPATFVFRLCLVGERRRAVSPAEVFRLNQTSSWIDFSYLAHRENCSATLREECAGKREGIAFVRVPVAVKTTEASCC
jgi:hypothetical protein